MAKIIRTQVVKFVRAKAWLRLGILFLVVGVSASVFIQNSTPPFAKLVVAVSTYAITINFSIPLSIGYIGLTPIVANSTLLDGGIRLEDAMIAAVMGQALAEMVRPAWRPLAQSEFARPVYWQDRFMLALFHFANLFLVGLMSYPFGDGGFVLVEQIALAIPNTAVNTLSPLLITATYFTLFVLFYIVYWRVRGANPGQFFNEASPHLISIIFFAVPLMLFISSADIGIPAFFLLMVSIATFAILNGRSWLGRIRSEQRMMQFSKHNDISRQMRETLDLNTVLEQIHHMVKALIPTEQFALTLLSSDGQWQQSISTVDEMGKMNVVILPDIEPDDLTRYVVQSNRRLDLTPANIHYTKKYDLALPLPRPRVWYGLPLTTTDATEKKTIGAMVIQRVKSDEPFSQWNHEMFQAIASQANASIENARLYNQTDTALSRRLEQLQALLFSIAEGVLMVDAAANIVLINPTAALLIGDDWHQLRGTQLDIEATSATLGFTPEQLSTLLDRLAEGSELQTDDYIYTVMADDDTIRHTQRSIVPVTSDDAVLMGWLMVFRDVTEERERIAWRADLTRMIVHDLRNPITTISNSVSMISSEVGSVKQSNFVHHLDPHLDTHIDSHRSDIVVDDLLNTADYSCTALLEMVDSLLDINRAEAGTFVIDAEAMRLPPLVNRTLQQLTPLAKQRGITLTAICPGTLPAVWADEEIMRRVLVNLLDNALKFTPRNGFVEINLSTSPPTESHESGIIVRISDSGPGVPADQKERIFDRFVTFNRGGGQVRGTGLGLTFCKLAIEAHDSTIWVEDVPSGGTVFVFNTLGIPRFIA